jgi:eukaryotic-like serine/threonine-protein kinase
VNRSWRALVGLLIVVTTGAAFQLGRSARRSGSPPSVLRLDSALPLSDRLDDAPALTLSPDGKVLAYVARRNSVRRLFVRPLDHATPDAVDGTEGARHPSFSPNGQLIAFVSGTAVKAVTVDRRLTEFDCNVGDEAVFGVAWQDSGRVVVGSQRSGLRRCDLAAHSVERLTDADATHGELAHRFPEVLPGGSAILFTIVHGQLPSSIAVLSLQTGQVQVVEADGAGSRYVPTSHIVFGREGHLWAAPFDAVSLRATGSAVRFVDNVDTSPEGGPQVAFSQDGKVFVHGAGAGDELVWVDPANGTVSSVSGVRGQFWHPRVSPDGRLLTAERHSVVTGETAIWLFDSGSGAARRLTGRGTNVQPTWSRDGQWIMFATYDDNAWSLRRASSGPSAETQLLLASEESSGDEAAPDQQLTTASGAATWVLPRSGPAVREQQCPPVRDVSPDGRWTISAAQGDIRVAERTGPRREVIVAQREASEPRWPAGPEISFRQQHHVLAATIDAKAAAVTGTRVLFTDIYKADPCGVANYDRSPVDGRFVMVKPDDVHEPTRLTFLFHGLFEDLRRAAPAAQPPRE